MSLVTCYEHQKIAGERVLLARPVTCGQTLVTDDVGGQFVTFKG